MIKMIPNISHAVVEHFRLSCRPYDSDEVSIYVIRTRKETRRINVSLQLADNLPVLIELIAECHRVVIGMRVALSADIRLDLKRRRPVNDKVVTNFSGPGYLDVREVCHYHVGTANLV